MSPLSNKQKSFVTEYLLDHNASQACVRAGYSKKNPNVVGPRLLANVGIKKAIEAKMKKREDATIADRNERQRFWTQSMRDRELEFQHRVKCSELLGKSEADFTEKHEVTGADGEPIILQWEPPTE